MEVRASLFFYPCGFDELGTGPFSEPSRQHLLGQSQTQDSQLHWDEPLALWPPALVEKSWLVCLGSCLG